MRYILKVNPLLLKDQTLGVGDLIDAIRKERPSIYFSSGFLDHTKNSIEIVAGQDFQELIEDFFPIQIAKGAIIIEIAGSNHASTHKTFINIHGYMVCGCGWIETFEQRRDRETKNQLSEMKVIPMDLGL